MANIYEKLMNVQQELKAQAAILKKSKGKISLAASGFTFD